MAYNEETAALIRRNIPDEELPHFTEKKMFGGVAFMYNSKMSIGVVKDDLMVRVIQNKMDAILAKPFVRPMDFTKRPMKEFIYVQQEGYDKPEMMKEWISLGIEHAQSKGEEK